MFARDGVNIEIRFDGDDAADEVGVDAVFFGGVVNQGIERGRGGGKRLLVGGEHVFGIDGEDVGLGDGESAAGHGEDEIGAVVSVAGDVEAFAGAEDSVVGARGSERRRSAAKRVRMRGGEARERRLRGGGAERWNVVVLGHLKPGERAGFNYLVSIAGHLEFGCERGYLVG